jgi:hypothetical protein
VLHLVLGPQLWNSPLSLYWLFNEPTPGLQVIRRRKAAAAEASAPSMSNPVYDASATGKHSTNPVCPIP